MVSIGYALSSEEHSALDLVEWARGAEAAGFSFALLSDHYQPWVDAQGQSPFVWATLGAIATATKRLQIGTGVTCPLIRIHPAVVAQAAATVASMMPGRFFLGVGTGEQLNEHVTGEAWPVIAQRRAMLAEAIEVIRALWSGETTSFEGDYYVVEDARIYSMPPETPPIYVAASGTGSARLAGEHGDGLIAVAPNPEVVAAFESAGGRGPRLGQVTVCWARSEAEARRTVHRMWPNSALPGSLSADLRRPADFEVATSVLSEEQAVEHITCGPDADRHVEAIRQYMDAGYDHVYVHQVGPDQPGFFDFYQREVLPRLDAVPPRLVRDGA